MNHSRVRLVQFFLLCGFLAVSLRLIYWQVFAADTLKQLAASQYQFNTLIPANRGEILAADNFPLVANQNAYLLYAYKPALKENVATIAKSLSPLLLDHIRAKESSESALLSDEIVLQLTESTLSAKLSQAALSWVPLERDLDEKTKTAIESLNYSGLGFEAYQLRRYPESSMAAQLLGFVGSDGTGRPKGYFGLEGFYNLELYGQPGLVSQDKDALGKPIIIGQYQKTNSIDGRHLITHIDRGLQLIVETELAQALEYYRAVSGEVVIMEPLTGAIIALASLPAYDPATYKSFDSEQFRLPAVADTYEPGSTFKTIILAGAIEAGAVTPETTCDDPCAGPVSMGRYQIKTWNNVYNSGQTVREILMRSDNVGMVFIAGKMGQKTFLNNLDNFGIGRATGIDLQREAVAPLRSTWAQIDVATGSFGQGLAVNSLQMVSAVGALANGGKMMQPQVVDYLVEVGKIINREPKVLSQPVSAETARVMTQLMVDAAAEGEAKWAIPKGYRIAGKTGTAQVAIAGHYDATKTIASFIGFAPAENPRFVMLVKLQEPQSSPWASETAAPLWVDIAKKIFLYLNITPGN